MPNAASVPTVICGQTVAGSATSRVFNVATASKDGDTILLEVVANSSSAGVTAITDSKGNIYTLDQSVATSPAVYGFRSPGLTGGGGGGSTQALTTSDTFTVTCGAVSMNVTVYAVAVSGLGTYNISTVNNTSSTSLTSSVSVSMASSTLISLCAETATGGTPSFDAPMTMLDQRTLGQIDSCAYQLDGGASGAHSSVIRCGTSTALRQILWGFNPMQPYVCGMGSSANAGSYSFGVTTALRAGDVLCAGWGSGQTTDTLTAISDSQGGTWTLMTNNAGTGRGAGWAVRTAGSALSLTDTITVSWAGTTTTRVTLIGIPQQAGQQVVVDLSPTPAGSGGSPTSFSAATGTLGFQNEICLGSVCIASNPAVTVESWTRLSLNVSQTPTHLTYSVLPGATTASQTCSGTIGTGNAYGESLLTLAYQTAIAPITGTGAIAAKKISLAGSGTYTVPPITGTGAIAAKKIALSGSGTYTPGITGTGAFSAKKIKLAGTGTYTFPAFTGTGSFTAKKIALSGLGSVAGAITGTGAFSAKKIKLAGTGTYTPGITGTGSFVAKKIRLAGTGTSGATPGITGTGAFVAKKIQLYGEGGPVIGGGAAVALPAAPELVPVVWAGVNLNGGDQADGTCLIVTGVEGWYGSPPLIGNDLARVLADGAVYGTKTLGARVVTIQGAVTGPRAAVLAFARELGSLAVADDPADLSILEDDDTDDPVSLTAQVRGDTDALTHAWMGRTAFTWQVVLTAADPRLYEATRRTATLSIAGTGGAGRGYPWTPPRFYATTDIPNQAVMPNPGDVPAPVLLTYNGPLGSSRLTDGTSQILLQALQAGEVVYVNSETLVAAAAGGATRASYVLAGSQPMLVPANSIANWSLYATGTGSVGLDWAGTYA